MLWDYQGKYNTHIKILFLVHYSFAYSNQQRIPRRVSDGVSEWR